MDNKSIDEVKLFGANRQSITYLGAGPIDANWLRRELAAGGEIHIPEGIDPATYPITLVHNLGEFLLSTKTVTVKGSGKTVKLT